MHFRFIPLIPDPLLKPYVAKMWVFESGGKLPEFERKLIVPNANFKLALTYRNGIVSRIGNTAFVQKENELKVSGLIDVPVVLDAGEDIPTGTIGIELNPAGAYRLFKMPFQEMTNQIVGIDEVLGKRAIYLQERLADTNSVSHKIHLLQEFLIRQLGQTEADPIYDYCVHRITNSQGILSIGQLEKETGYTSRWLHTKFTNHLGTNPKNLSAILRFKQFYEAFSTGAEFKALKNHIYSHYYDQSHFLRAFKRFTGTTPTDLQKNINQLSTEAFKA